MSKAFETHHVVLMGMMGVGKSTIGSLSAKYLGWPFVDLDHFIENEEKMAIPQIFETHGEAYFRSCEARYLEKICARRRPTVIALGGGSMMSEVVRKLVRPHWRIWLDAPPRALWARVRYSPRPLVRMGAARFRALYFSRRIVFLRCSQLRLTTHLAHASVAAHHIARWVRMQQSYAKQRSVAMIKQELTITAQKSFSSTVVIGQNFWDQLDWSRYLKENQSVFCVYDPQVQSLVNSIAESLQKNGHEITHVAMAMDEAHKNLETVDRVYQAMGERALTRDSVVLAIGGGVLTDLVGYAAATYLRGLSWITVPTTLLAQVDAAIGGKTGVNTLYGKNLVGAFHLPQAVMADVQALYTLPV
ncbi:MAG: iron-containing alcohol dehydrogenase, partial [Firmicutes bacterium]|nr:iron-containing alcohol dehydrogenase [Bacillota bacterium]